MGFKAIQGDFREVSEGFYSVLGAFIGNARFSRTSVEVSEGIRGFQKSFQRVSGGLIRSRWL